MMSSDAEIVEAAGAAALDPRITALLERVYVAGGFTDAALAIELFAPAAVARRGHVLLAVARPAGVVGMVICASPDNPYRQVAAGDEAEMQLLAVDPGASGRGLGRALCRAFERKAVALGYRQAVLSTQPAMHAAHRLYVALGYARNAARDWARAQRSFLVYEKQLELSAA